MRRHRSNLGLFLLCTCVFAVLVIGKTATAQEEPAPEEAPNAMMTKIRLPASGVYMSLANAQN